MMGLLGGEGTAVMFSRFGLIPAFHR